LLCIRNWGIPFFLDQELLLLIDKENIRYRLDTELGIPAVKGTSKFREDAASTLTTQLTTEGGKKQTNR